MLQNTSKIGARGQHVAWRLGELASHQINPGWDDRCQALSTRNEDPPSPGRRKRQGVGNCVLLEVDGAHGKHVMKLSETSIVPSIDVNLFSLQRVTRGGYLPAYGEVEGKCQIKKKTQSGELVQVATMSVVNGRCTLDYQLVEHSFSSSGAALQSHAIEGFKVELTMTLLHRRMGHGRCCTVT